MTAVAVTETTEDTTETVTETTEMIETIDIKEETEIVNLNKMQVFFNFVYLH